MTYEHQHTRASLRVIVANGRKERRKHLANGCTAPKQCDAVHALDRVTAAANTLLGNYELADALLSNRGLDAYGDPIKSQLKSKGN